MKKKPRNQSNGFDEWGGYMEAKKRKLEEQFELDANAGSSRGGIFQGVAIFVNGYTVPSAEELKALMLLHGGIYHHYESSRTTHIIASNLPHTKIKKLKGGEKIVKPEWILESIASGRLLDYKKFLLMTSLDNAKPLAKLFQKSSSEAQNSLASLIDENDTLQKYSNEERSTSNKEYNSVEMVSSNAKGLKNALDTKSKGLNKQTTFSLSDSKTDPLLKTPYPEKVELKNSTERSNEHSYITSNVDTDNSLESVLQERGKQNNIIETNAVTKIDKDCPSEKSDPKESSKILVSKTVNISAPKVQGASTKTASNEDFLGEFYSNSRLHHLSTMGAMFKQYVNELREKHDGQFNGKQSLLEWKSTHNITSVEDMDETFSPSTSEPVVMHIDMDCFFVSVGTRNDPSLRQEPVAVAHSKGNSSKPREGVNRQAEFDIYRQRTMNKLGLNSENHTRFEKVNSIGNFDSMSEIASCNYKARDFGLKNGMFVGHALKKCPTLKIVPYDFDGYKEVSYALYNVIASLTLNIEAVSCDEMYVECTQLLQDVDLTPLQFATYLRESIARETRCTCSTGFGSNKLQARLATKRAKPNGQFHLTSEILTHFMLNIPLGDLPGVGHSLLYKLNGLGAQTCGDLQRVSLATLQSEFGSKSGITLYNQCRGQDDKELTFEHQRKSVSAEVNYGIRFQNHGEMETFVRQLSGEVEKRLEEVKMKGKCVTLKLMVRSAEAPREASKFLGHGVCDYITKSASLQVYISQANQIFKEVMSIMQKLKVDPKEMRGVGIQMSKLELESKTLPTIDSFFTSKSKSAILPDNTENRVQTKYTKQASNQEKSNELTCNQTEPTPVATVVHTSPGKKLIFVPDSELIKSPKRKARSPKKKSPAKLGNMKLYLMKARKVQVPDGFDMSVFESLPEDIKQEVLQSTEQQKLNKATESRPSHSNKTDQVSSHESKTILSDSHVSSNSASSHSNEMNIAPSLDESFLNALPEDIRREVLDDYCRAQAVSNRTHEVTNKTREVTNRTGEVSNEACEVTNRIHDQTKGTAEQTPTKQNLEEDMDESPTNLNKSTQILSSNVSLQEMRVMLREWLCEDRPESSDVNMFSAYLTNLVEERKLSQIVAHMRFLQRHIARRQDELWRETLNEITSQVQSSMLKQYGYVLYI